MIKTFSFSLLSLSKVITLPLRSLIFASLLPLSLIQGAKRIPLPASTKSKLVFTVTFNKVQKSLSEVNAVISRMASLCDPIQLLKTLIYLFTSAGFDYHPVKAEPVANESTASRARTIIHNSFRGDAKPEILDISLRQHFWL